MKITRYLSSSEQVPVDFFADPDGVWDYDTLIEAAGFARDAAGIQVGALCAPYRGHPEGAAVISAVRAGEAALGAQAMVGRYFAVVECPVQVPVVQVPVVQVPVVQVPVVQVPVVQVRPVAPAVAQPVLPQALPQALPHALPHVLPHILAPLPVAVPYSGGGAVTPAPAGQPSRAA